MIRIIIMLAQNDKKDVLSQAGQIEEGGSWVGFFLSNLVLLPPSFPQSETDTVPFISSSGRYVFNWGWEGRWLGDFSLSSKKLWALTFSLPVKLMTLLSQTKQKPVSPSPIPTLLFFVVLHIFPVNFCLVFLVILF